MREEQMKMRSEQVSSEAMIKLVSQIIIEICIIGSLMAVWHFYYGDYAFQKYYVLGSIVTIVLYTVVYNALGRMYKAFKIGAYQIGETILSQIISFGLADLLIYVECVLSCNFAVSILPGVITVLAQIFFTIIWAVCAKRYFIRHVRPAKTLLIYGFEDRTEFLGKLQKKCSHIFDIQEEISAEHSIKELMKKINQFETVILCSVPGSIRTDIMEYCIRMGKGLYLTPRIADIIIEGCEKRHLIDTPMFKYEYNYKGLLISIQKRVLDFLLSAIAVILLSPFILVTAIAIKIEDGGNIFFKQDRCTKDGKVFQIYKFRSMIMDAEKNGALPCTSNDDRITKVGRFIRKVRIDEIPQLFNVLKGDMSFVGPRPERVEHVKQYTEELPEFNYRLRVKGGITGYAQIFGKYNTSPYDKLRLDMMYIENQSLWLDMKLILLTIKTVFIPESTEGFEKEKSKVIAEANKRYGKFSGEVV